MRVPFSLRGSSVDLLHFLFGSVFGLDDDSLLVLERGLERLVADLQPDATVERLVTELMRAQKDARWATTQGNAHDDDLAVLKHDELH